MLAEQVRGGAVLFSTDINDPPSICDGVEMLMCADDGAFEDIRKIAARLHFKSD